MAGEERWEALVETMLDQSSATYGADGSGAQRAFGSTSLKTSGKIFAMLVKGKLVVKLSARRVDELIASGGGERFDPGHGRLMVKGDPRWLIRRLSCTACCDNEAGACSA